MVALGKLRTMKGKTSLAPQTGPGSISLQDAKIYEEHSLTELRNAGYRITMPRVQVIRALGDTTRALSAYAIHEKIINSGGKIDVVSVYRILSTLQEVGLIHHIGIVDGYFPCRMTDCHGKRSEVVVDESNGSVTELVLPDTIVEAIERQIQEAGYEASSIKVEITGTLVK
jgi:Fe2+ or Zn2+ uptake regulation protein